MKTLLLSFLALLSVASGAADSDEVVGLARDWAVKEGFGVFLCLFSHEDLSHPRKISKEGPVDLSKVQRFIVAKKQTLIKQKAWIVLFASKQAPERQLAIVLNTPSIKNHDILFGEELKDPANPGSVVR